MSLKSINKDYALKILMAGINVEDKESLKQGLQELIGSFSNAKEITPVIITENNGIYTANCTFDEFAELVEKGANVIVKNPDEDEYRMTYATHISKLVDSDTHFNIHFGDSSVLVFSPDGIAQQPT